MKLLSETYRLCYTARLSGSYVRVMGPSQYQLTTMTILLIHSRILIKPRTRTHCWCSSWIHKLHSIDVVGAPEARDYVLQAFTAKAIWEVENVEPKVAPAPLWNAAMKQIIRLADLAAILGCSSFQMSVVDRPWSYQQSLVGIARRFSFLWNRLSNREIFTQMMGKKVRFSRRENVYRIHTEKSKYFPTGKWVFPYGKVRISLWQTSTPSDSGVLDLERQWTICPPIATGIAVPWSAYSIVWVVSISGNQWKEAGDQVLLVNRLVILDASRTTPLSKVKSSE